MQLYRVTTANVKGNAPGIQDVGAGETEGCGDLWHQGSSTGSPVTSAPPSGTTEKSLACG